MGAQGTTTLDFGAFPGGSDASVAVTGQTGILSGSLVEAWLFPAATTDHTSDEHLVESLKVSAGNIVAGTGFTVYGVNTSQLTEQSQSVIPPGIYFGLGPNTSGRGTRIYGKWNIGWVWN